MILVPGARRLDLADFDGVVIQATKHPKIGGLREVLLSTIGKRRFNLHIMSNFMIYLYITNHELYHYCLMFLFVEIRWCTSF